MIRDWKFWVLCNATAAAVGTHLSAFWWLS